MWVAVPQQIREIVGEFQGAWRVVTLIKCFEFFCNTVNSTVLWCIKDEVQLAM